MAAAESGLLPAERRIGAKAPRDSSFELLRIVLMLLIITRHALNYSGFEGMPLLLANRTLWRYAAGWGQTGVAGFVLITGYFSCTSKAALPDLKKIARFALQVLFYSIAFLLALGVTGVVPLEEISLRPVQFLLPFTQTEYWFATYYLLLLLIAPFLNAAIERLGQKRHLALVLILFTVFSLIPSFLKVKYTSDRLVIFVLLYLLAAYCRLYAPPLFEKRWFAPALIAAGSLWIIYYRILLASLLPHIPRLAFLVNRSVGRVYDVPVLLFALGLFLLFRKLRVKSSRVINLVASGTFGVYLFHEHPLCRRFLWLRLFHAADYAESPRLLPYLAWVIALVFVTGIAIDLARQYALEKPLFRLIEGVWGKLKQRKKVTADP